jgi:isopentenyl-diphosphate Delta-isomerase
MSDIRVILVDEKDNQTGTEEKLAAHRKGLLHRAFSIFVYNTKGEMLIQKRAMGKYHSGGLWSNTCCSHPRPGEKLDEAIHRRLIEEMGFDCELSEKFSFIYKVAFLNNMNEHEYLHVFSGVSDAAPIASPEEASEYKWINKDELKKDVTENPDAYTYWFKIALSRGI